ncbi:MAG TPA: hypothetical protein VFY26_02225, partial [Anaerolineales bacterium]|nr:hypothetical protein [Anaerolineales bacterium]
METEKDPAQGPFLIWQAKVEFTNAIRCVHIQYLSIASWKEVLNVSTHTFNPTETGGARYVGITRADNSRVAECILDWELVDAR